MKLRNCKRSNNNNTKHHTIAFAANYASRLPHQPAPISSSTVRSITTMGSASSGELIVVFCSGATCAQRGHTGGGAQGCLPRFAQNHRWSSYNYDIVLITNQRKTARNNWTMTKHSSELKSEYDGSLINKHRQNNEVACRLHLLQRYLIIMSLKAFRMDQYVLVF